jgi:3-oxoacyl-[acyl-carrier-protein] synthase-3
MINSIITGTGSFIPDHVVKNADFLEAEFFDPKGEKYTVANEEIVSKFKEITGIEARRYADDNAVTSDIATIAAQRAIDNAMIDKETIDYIIVAHNFGDVKFGHTQSDLIPSLASRVKHNLNIETPNCVAYDVLFGCPGWIQGVIQAHAFIKAEMAERCLVIGAETLSRIVDPHDRDSMIYADGAGACIVEKKESDRPIGILSTADVTFAHEEAYYLHFGTSYNPEIESYEHYLKMHGRKIYNFALTNVPAAMKSCLDKSGLDIHDVSKVLIHQANEKMDSAIIKRLFRLYDNAEIPEHIMPMSIHRLGNSSVATVPTLFDLVLKGKLENHSIHSGDVLLMASVGAGMNINAIVYKCPGALKE